MATNRIDRQLALLSAFCLESWRVREVNTESAQRAHGLLQLVMASMASRTASVLLIHSNSVTRMIPCPSSLILKTMSMSTKAGGAASATVRAVKRRKMLPTRAALTLVKQKRPNSSRLPRFVNHPLFLFQTPAAVERVKELVDTKPSCIGLKIGVRQRGCNGLSYVLDYAEQKEKFDEEVVQVSGIHR